jgi:hypothetical protein
MHEHHLRRLVAKTENNSSNKAIDLETENPRRLLDLYGSFSGMFAKYTKG